MSLRPWTVALTQRNDNDHDPSNACRSRRVKSSIHAHNDFFPSQNGTEKVSKVLVKCFVKQYSFMPQTVVGGIQCCLIGTYSVWQCIILYIHPNFCLPNLSLTTCWIAFNFHRWSVVDIGIDRNYFVLLFLRELWAFVWFLWCWYCDHPSSVKLFWPVCFRLSQIKSQHGRWLWRRKYFECLLWQSYGLLLALVLWNLCV